MAAQKNSTLEEPEAVETMFQMEMVQGPHMADIQLHLMGQVEEDGLVPYPPLQEVQEVQLLVEAEGPLVEDMVNLLVGVVALLLLGQPVLVP